MSRVSNNRNLKITCDKEKKEINIFGNREGLEYLSKICQNIACSKIGEHYHFSSWTKDIELAKDSLDLVIWIVEETERGQVSALDKQ